MMSSRAKKAKLNDDLINQILEIDNSSNSSEFSDFYDTDEDVTYNPNSSESDVEGKKKFFFSLKSIGKGVKNNIFHTILFYNKNNRYIYLKYFYVIRQV